MSDEIKKEVLKEIEIAKTTPYSRHVYKEYSEDKLASLAESIKAYGVIEPILVRPIGKEGEDIRYEIIAGHNRVKAADMAGLTMIPAQIKTLTDDEADIHMVESNAMRRDEMLPSEKGKAYKAYLEANKRQGKRPELSDLDLTSGRIGQKSSTRNKLAVLYGETETQVRRYIDLVKLIQELLDLVDTKKLPMNSAVNISILNQTEQREVYSKIKDNPKRLNIAASTNLRKAKMEKALKTKEIGSIIDAANDNKKAPATRTLKLSTDLINEYFTDAEQDDEAIMEKIKEALELLRNNE